MKMITYVTFDTIRVHPRAIHINPDTSEMYPEKPPERQNFL